MPAMDDLDELAAILGNPRVMKFLGPNCQPVSKEESKEILASILRLWERKGFGRLAVVLRENGRLIGLAGFRFFEGDAELFYLLDEPHWNQGLATEVGRAVLRYGFETHGFRRVVAFTRPANTTSLRVLEKLGLKFEKTDVVAGVRACVYQITKKDFERLEK